MSSSAPPRLPSASPPTGAVRGGGRGGMESPPQSGIKRTFHGPLKEKEALHTKTVSQATLRPACADTFSSPAHAVEIAKRTHQFEQRSASAHIVPLSPRNRNCKTNPPVRAKISVRPHCPSQPTQSKLQNEPTSSSKDQRAPTLSLSAHAIEIAKRTHQFEQRSACAHIVHPSPRNRNCKTNPPVRARISVRPHLVHPSPRNRNRKTNPPVRAKQ
jgi:hypothetical protein